MPKKAASKPPVVWKQFVLFWWQECYGNRLSIYRTRTANDIEVFGRNHYRVHFHPDSTDDEEYEVIIRYEKGEWLIKLEDVEPFSTFCHEDDDQSIWTWVDDMNQELFTIRGELKA
jgi:hypothetical protein